MTVCRGAYCIKPILKHSGHAKNDYHLWYTHVGGMVPKCVICDGGSIFGVLFFGKNFPLYSQLGLRKFSSLARKTYESPNLSPNNSEIWGYRRHFFMSYIYLTIMSDNINRSPTYCTFPRCFVREHATFNGRLARAKRTIAHF